MSRSALKVLRLVPFFSLIRGLTTLRAEGVPYRRGVDRRQHQRGGRDRRQRRGVPGPDPHADLRRHARRGPLCAGALPCTKRGMSCLLIASTSSWRTAQIVVKEKQYSASDQ